MVSSVPEPKHVACARCRDRKVKCDGGKPGCKRCHRNGTPCKYVRGRKQQTRSEWVQHLRTFSSQPARGNVTHSLDRPSSQPALPQTPDTRVQRPHFVDDNLSCYARSPSPYLFEHTAIEVDGGQSAAPGCKSFISRTNAEDCNALWLSTSSNDAEFPDSHLYNFEPATSFFDTNFTSDLVTTTNSQAGFPSYPAHMRSHTPISQVSETTSSYDGLSDILFSYKAFPHCVPIAAEALTWNAAPTHEEQTSDYSSPYRSSLYS